MTRELITAQDRQKRTIMHRFRIEELSAVDRPAQSPALATIIKRDTSAGRFIKNVNIGHGHLDGRHIVHPEDIDRLLKLQGLQPLLADELEFAGTLTGDERREFLLGGHFKRAEMKLAKMSPEKLAAGNEKKRNEDTNMTRLANKASEAASFDTFQDAVAHIQKQDGVAGTAAMQKARREYPALYEKLRKDGEGVSVAKVRQQERAEHSALVAKRQSVQQAVRKHARENGISELQAMRELRRSPQSPWAD